MTYDDFEKALTKEGYAIKDLPLTTTSEDGEIVVVTVAGVDDDNKLIWKTVTCQKNNWIRTNIYYFDGTMEELYEYGEEVPRCQNIK